MDKEERQLYVRRFFRRVFFEDWGTKLFALGITLALWFGVTGLRTSATVRLKNVTLNPRILNDMEITNTPIMEVDIVVTGDKQTIDRLNVRDLIMSVDLTEVKSGDRIVQLTPQSVGLDLPSGLKLEEIQPNKIGVRLEKVEEREVEVKPDLEGTLADGFEIYSSNVAPARVRIRGAVSFIKSLGSISTEKINIADRKESFVVRQIGLSIMNPKITLLDTIVDASFVIGEKRAERIFSVPVKIENKIRNATVVVYGGRSILEKLRPEELRIDMTILENGTEVPRLILPPDLENKLEARKIKLPQ